MLILTLLLSQGRDSFQIGFFFLALIFVVAVYSALTALLLLFVDSILLTFRAGASLYVMGPLITLAVLSVVWMWANPPTGENGVLLAVPPPTTAETLLTAAKGGLHGAIAGFAFWVLVRRKRQGKPFWNDIF
jgi:hypothetical protein